LLDGALADTDGFESSSDPAKDPPVGPANIWPTATPCGVAPEPSDTVVWVPPFQKETEFPVEFATTTVASSGVVARPTGPPELLSEVVTVLVTVLITETVPDPEFVTYALCPSDESATAAGEEPTVID
jgi:hypothetical protein